MKKKKFSPIKLLLLLTLTTVSLKAIGYIRMEEDALSTAWGMPLERHLTFLLDEGRLDEKHTPWADYHWPRAEGSIAQRWVTGEKNPLEYRIATLPELIKLNPAARRERLKHISPAEKFDIARLQFSYPLFAKLRAEYEQAFKAGSLSGDSSDLERGWAIASTHLLEPKDTSENPVVVKVPHPKDPRQWVELEIPFAASDVKGLLAYYFGVQAYGRVQKYQVGANCSGTKSQDCRSIDPASFHVILSNMIGKMGRSFVLDIDPGANTVHRPVVAFDSDVRYQSDGHYRVTTKVEVARLRAPDWKAYDFFNLDTEAVFYEYTLEVNTRGEVVRGQWLSEMRPEFAWRSDLPTVEKDFRILAEQLYQPAKKSRGLSAIGNLFE